MHFVLSRLTWIARSVRVLEQTKQVGADPAKALQAQTATAERIVDKLDEIQFNLKKSGMLIRHLTRSVATDKYVGRTFFITSLFVTTSERANDL